jgi:hypothetical protein
MARTARCQQALSGRPAHDPLQVVGLSIGSTDERHIRDAKFLFGRLMDRAISTRAPQIVERPPSRYQIVILCSLRTRHCNNGVGFTRTELERSPMLRTLRRLIRPGFLFVVVVWRSVPPSSEDLRLSELFRSRSVVDRCAVQICDPINLSGPMR